MNRFVKVKVLDDLEQARLLENPVDEIIVQGGIPRLLGNLMVI